MSFKAKQRAKHGHLFGDGNLDPLNAALVSTSDDPLFTPTKSSQSTRTNTPIPSDPLTRNIIDSSNSTPLFTRRVKNDSIFGDIDVSKLGRRSPNTLKSDKLLEEDEGLFGAMKRTRKSPVSDYRNEDSTRKSQPVRLTASNPVSPIHQPIPPQTKIPTVTYPQQEENTQQKDNKQEGQQRLKQQEEQQKRKQQEEQQNHKQEEELSKEKHKEITEEKRNSSFFASASRFFKSTSNIKPSPPPSRTSSLNGDKKQTEPVSVVPEKPEMEPIRAPVKEVVKEPIKRPLETPTIKERPPPEEDTTEEPIIEDEATRAFADETIVFPSKGIDYTFLPPDLLAEGMDSLKIRTPLLPSISTPTHTVDVDPWALQLEPSTSSPVIQIPSHEIEPQKRRVFADLITSWNTGQSNRLEATEEEDSEEFFQHVAEEQRDVGFAGINESPIKAMTVNIWEDVENPWG